MSARSRATPWWKRKQRSAEDLFDAARKMAAFGSRYYSRSAERLSLLEFSILYEDRNYVVVKKTPLPDGGEVSTVWVGIDHNFSTEGPPIIFETLVFPACELGERYATVAQALEGHARITAQCLAAGEATQEAGAA